jgi:hypothetical protein
MVVLLYALEIEVRNELDAPDTDKFLEEAAGAYRARARVLRARGRQPDAAQDLKRAAKLEAQAKKIAAKKKPAQVRASGKKTAAANKPTAPVEGRDQSQLGRIRLINQWTSPVTVWVDGIAFRVGAGRHRVLIRDVGTFTYEIPAAGHKGKRSLKAGLTFTIRIR